VIKALTQPQLFQQGFGTVSTLTAVLAAQQAWQLDVFQCIQRGDQHKRLKDEANVFCSQRGARLFVHAVQRLPHQVHIAAAAIIQPGEDRQ
jgi:acyl-CoA thioesterase-1